MASLPVHFGNFHMMCIHLSKMRNAMHEFPWFSITIFLKFNYLRYVCFTLSERSFYLLFSLTRETTRWNEAGGHGRRRSQQSGPENQISHASTRVLPFVIHHIPRYPTGFPSPPPCHAPPPRGSPPLDAKLTR
jgi:hypothetical protein